jgi:hypothetical protein
MWNTFTSSLVYSWKGMALCKDSRVQGSMAAKRVRLTSAKSMGLSEEVMENPFTKSMMRSSTMPII